MIFVSHNMGAVTNLCGSGLVIEKGAIAFRGRVGDAVNFYNRGLLAPEEASGRAPHVLYDAPENSAQHDFSITRVEMLDVKGNPKPMLSTFDDVVFRFWYHTKRPPNQEAVEFELRDLNGTRLLLLSTWPDDTMRLPREAGTRSVDCVLEQVPFAAGDYVLGGRVSIPYVQYRWVDLDNGPAHYPSSRRIQIGACASGSTFINGSPSCLETLPLTSASIG